MQAIIYDIIIAFLTINTLLAVITVFRQKREVAAIWAWLMVLLMLPGFGFILYFFLGRKISDEEIFKLSEQEALGMTSLVNKYVDEDGELTTLDAYDKRTKRTIHMLYRSNMSVLTQHNTADIYIDGNDKIAQLLKDIKAAQHHIHMQYYIFTSDHVGQKILDALLERARAGVKVRFLYDPLGSRKLDKKYLRALQEAGAEVNSFFGRTYFFINMRLNFRNHRKLVIIDGRIGYIGGFNIAKEYVNEGPLGHWRDTHLRLEGEVVQALQTRFVQDWCATFDMTYHDWIAGGALEEHYFPNIEKDNDLPIQIVSSGPEDDIDQVKIGYIRLINMAKECVYIQTPYFIPDESVLDALKIAILSGVEVHLMIPCKPDHPFVYRATEYYARTILEMGAHIHRYDHGFLHSKVVIVDQQLASVGTANFDIRSFSLNFEVNAFIYEPKLIKQLIEFYHEDMTKSTDLDLAYFKSQSRWRKFKQNFSRLLSPIL